LCCVKNASFNSIGSSSTSYFLITAITTKTQHTLMASPSNIYLTLALNGIWPHTVELLIQCRQEIITQNGMTKFVINNEMNR
ncbi:7020_t:CDS:2, partial [Funneliformis geosporum]